MGTNEFIVDDSARDTVFSEADYSEIEEGIFVGGLTTISRQEPLKPEQGQH